MGLLDDAIREHLELKRRHGADPDEVSRQEREALDLPLLDGDGTLKVTASFGAASLAKSANATDGKDSLVAAADAALYRAKRSGKNRTVRAE